jgi:hypothetical protein
MKSSFLLTIVLALLPVIGSAQITAKSKRRVVQKKSSFDKFYDRLRIGYFGVFTSPNFHEMKNDRWKNAAISKQYSGGTNKDTWPTNIWHQVSFNYNFGAKMNFVVNPRFMTPLLNGRDMKAPEDRSFIMIDDVLVGFQGVFSSDDKKFNFWIRPGVRLPTSRASRNSGNGGAGTTTHQIDISYNPTYDFDKTWQLGMFGQLRQWVIDDQYGFDRFRIISNPYIQYTINDVSKIQVYYENFLETDRRSKPADDRDPVFKDQWQNVTVGYARDVTSKLNLFPFIGCFIDQPLTDKSLWIGSWISYQIK